MTLQEIDQIGQVIRKERFHFRAEGIRALADYFAATVPDFDREYWFARIESRAYQPKTGQPCHCKPGVHRDNCPDCEGTGQRIDFAKIRAKHEPDTLAADVFENENTF
jgi:hypothetical protein